mgnify:CR=1 FL=1
MSKLVHVAWGLAGCAALAEVCAASTVVGYSTARWTDGPGADGRVYAVALRIMRHADLAEEVVSDVYMQVWRDAHRYDASRGRVLAWLLIISRSRALDLLRRQDEAFSHPDPHELVAEPDSGQKTAQDLLQASQEGSALHAAMATLTPLQRQLLSLAFFRGLSHSEIVAHCGLPLGTVKTHIRRALGALRDALGPAAESNG